jgi:hypothetical protein
MPSLSSSFVPTFQDAELLNGSNDTSMNHLPPPGSLVALVGGLYNGLFATVSSYTPASARLRIAHGVAQPWARSTLNVNVVVRHRSIRIANYFEHSLFTSPLIPCSSPYNVTDLGLPPISEANYPPSIQPNTKNTAAPVKPDIELLARFVALRIGKIVRIYAVFFFPNLTGPFTMITMTVLNSS